MFLQFLLTVCSVLFDVFYKLLLKCKALDEGVLVIIVGVILIVSLSKFCYDPF